MGRQEEEFLAGQGADGLGTSQLHAEESKEATFVHPEARKLFKKAPCLRYVPLFGEASEGYGPKPVLAIGLSYFLSKGLANRLLNGSLIAMFLNRFGIEGILFQRLANLSNMGWSVKPLTAVTSDIFPFFGYTKRWYMFAACLIGPIFSLIFGLLPAKESSAVIGAVCVFVAGLSKANTDILTQGHYSRMIRRVPTPGPALVSWVWWFIILGGLIGSFVVGPLGDAELPHISPFISSAVQLMVLPFFVLNWFGELPNREERYQDALIFHELDAKKREEARKEAAKAGEGNQQLIHGEPLGQDAVEAEQGNEDDAMKPLVFKEPRDCCCGAFQINEEVFQRNKRETIYSILIALCVIAVALTSMFGVKAGSSYRRDCRFSVALLFQLLCALVGCCQGEPLWLSEQCIHCELSRGHNALLPARA
uniref:WGS project CAEQ00000000 data, annotated contig 2285 n=1 Tax=Trypanosoma congolense (strain IL3000) TaxID=1068625 RepID=F9WCW5_TRYCI|nr:unnamed protein product [Trypanosoma congolense IL3000]